MESDQSHRLSGHLGPNLVAGNIWIVTDRQSERLSKGVMAIEIGFTFRSCKELKEKLTHDGTTIVLANECV